MFDAQVLEQIWKAVATHLWQSTLVIAALLLPYLLLRNGPARLRNMLWSLALAKLFIPLPLLARLREPLAHYLAPLVPGLLKGGLGSNLAGKMTYILDPVGSAAAPPVADPAKAILYLALTAAWLLGAGWLLYRWGRQAWDRQGRATGPEHGTPVIRAEPDIRKRVLMALEGTRIAPGVVRVVRGAELPAVTGIIWRRITVSERMVLGLEPSELRAILLHEQEHRRRFDPLRAVAQRLALAAFFYYPPLWAVLRQLDITCELACDQAAVRAGVKPSAFARALARSLELGLTPVPAAAGLGLKAKSTMQNRFEHITQPGRLVTMKRHRFALLGAVALVVMITAFPLPSCVKEGDTPPPPEPPDVVEVPEPPDIGDDQSVTPPSPIQETMVLPEYPEAERDAGIEGAVMLEAQILKDGSVGKVTVVEGVEGHPALEESAIAAMRNWKFEPATDDGKPIDMTVQIPLAFRLDGHKKAGPESGGEAETMPELLQESIVKPAYPEEARKAGVTGRVILEVAVNADGTTGEAKVKQGIPGYPGFGEAAITAVKQWKFKPATRGGTPVSATVMIPVQFNLDEEKEG